MLTIPRHNILPMHPKRLMLDLHAKIAHNAPILQPKLPILQNHLIIHIHHKSYEYDKLTIESINSDFDQVKKLYSKEMGIFEKYDVNKPFWELVKSVGNSGDSVVKKEDGHSIAVFCSWHSFDKMLLMLGMTIKKWIVTSSVIFPKRKNLGIIKWWTF